MPVNFHYILYARLSLQNVRGSSDLAVVVTPCIDQFGLSFMPVNFKVQVDLQINICVVVVGSGGGGG